MRKIFLFLLILIVTISPAALLAQTDQESSGNQGLLEGLRRSGSEAYQPGEYRLPFLGIVSPTEPRSPLIIAGLLINSLLGLVGLFFLVQIIYAGFKFMFSEGGDNKKEAQATLRNAGIGIFIILAAYSISYFVLRQVEEAVIRTEVEIGGEVIELPSGGVETGVDFGF